MNMMRLCGNKKANCFFYAGLILLSLFSAINKILYGLDMDETYILLLTQKINSGAVLYQDLWDMHQNCASVINLFYTPWQYFFGERGSLIYLRSVTTLILLLVSVFVFYSLRKYYNQKTAFVVAVFVFNFLPRATLQLEYGLSSILFSLISNILLLDILGIYSSLLLFLF